MTTTHPPAPSSAPASAADLRPPSAGRLARLWRGRPEDRPAVRPALFALLLATAVLYLWNLSASGWANSYYSAAVQAGSRSWQAFLFGSLDAAGAITVDKPPASLWPMALAARVFGVNSWSVLVPQALMGVATVAVVYAAVRRRFSAAAGLLAGAVLALTPVAALMFRFNNPDALLTLLLTLTVYFVLRALEDGRTKWLVWAGVAVGFAFLTKTLQAFLILPPLAVLYAVCAPVRPRRRFTQLGLSALAMTAAAGWWVALVGLWPASSRPYVGGSQHNSFWELTFGYNGLGRLNGEETGSVGGGVVHAGEPGVTTRNGGWGETGIGRMFNSEVGGQVSWLLPAALILLAAGIWLTWKARRTDTARAAFVAWGSSLLMTAAVFSFMAGIFHQYYTVVLAPSVAALVGMGATMLWEERARWWAGAALGATAAVTAWWAYVLLDRTPEYLPWLRATVLVTGLAAALGLLLAARLGRRLVVAAVGLGIAASLAGPVAYALSTAASAHRGSIPVAGPESAARPNGLGLKGKPGKGQTGQGQPGGPGGPGGQQQPPPGGQGQPAGGKARPGPGGPGGPLVREGGNTSGLLDGAQVGARAKRLLEQDADAYTWPAATVGAQNAASYQLATGDPVMAIGGFNGSDPSPTLARFKQYVADGRIHYFVDSAGKGGPMGRDGTASRITSWVKSHFTKVDAGGGATFYDLTKPKA